MNVPIKEVKYENILMMKINAVEIELRHYGGNQLIIKDY